MIYYFPLEYKRLDYRYTIVKTERFRSRDIFCILYMLLTVAFIENPISSAILISSVTKIDDSAYLIKTYYICYRYFGREKDAYIMVTDFLNKDLQTWFEACGKIFSEKTVCMIGMQAIEIIKFIHNKGYIHRDIKPESFMSGFEENARKVYISV